MKKIKLEFNIDLKPDILSGKYKVQTENGIPVEIVKWDCEGKYPILACINHKNRPTPCFYTEEGLDECRSRLVLYYEIEETALEKVLDELVGKIDEDFALQVSDYSSYIREFLPKIRKALAEEKENIALPQVGLTIPNGGFKEGIEWLIDKVYTMGKEQHPKPSIEERNIIIGSLSEAARKGIGATVLERNSNESASDYLLRCLSPELRDVWYEACDEIKNK